MAKLIDVIVPVYNRAHCLPRLIESFERQTCKDFRVIFVDDGSTDRSLELLNETKKTASFEVTVFSQENAGPGVARNTGMKAVTAEWFAFADSDDALQPQYLEYLLRAATERNADLGFCRYQFVPEDQSVALEPVGAFSCKEISASECMQEHCSSWMSLCGMIVRRSLQEEYGVFFDEACYYLEDAPFLCELISVASSAVLLEHKLYLYYTHAGSMIRSPRLDKFANGIECFDRTAKRIALSDTEAAKTFAEIGPVRYAIATLRKAAVQMPYRSFCQVSDLVKFRQYHADVAKLNRGSKLAARMMLLSKRLFFVSVKILFND